MNSKVDAFLEEFRQALAECGRFCYAARAREFQVESIEKLKKLKEKIAVLKAEMIGLRDEDSANCLLALEFTVNAMSHELEMWVSLKDDKVASAWDAVVSAEMSALDAMRAHAVAGHLEHYVEKLQLLQQLLFPPMWFMSPGLIILDSRCSICGSRYGECNHVKGEVYMGEMCAREITECRITETSITPEPANKHARIIAISDGNDARDLLTWRVVPCTDLQSVAQKLMV